MPPSPVDPAEEEAAPSGAAEGVFVVVGTTGDRTSLRNTEKSVCLHIYIYICHGCTNSSKRGGEGGREGKRHRGIGCYGGGGSKRFAGYYSIAMDAQQQQNGRGREEERHRMMGGGVLNFCLP